MRRSSESLIRHVHKAELDKANSGGDTVNEVDVVLRNPVNQYSVQDTTLSDNALERVRTLQQEKQIAFADLQEGLGAIARNEDSGVYENISSFFDREHATPVKYIENRDGAHVFQVNGKEITFGTLIADMVWDQVYDVFVSAAPSQLKKRYLLELAKQNMRYDLDSQLQCIQVDRLAENQELREVYAKYTNTYADIVDARGSVDVPKLAELSMRAIFTRAQYDMPDAPFSCIPADIEEDIGQGVDFFIRVKGEDPVKNVCLYGVDVTVSQSENALVTKSIKRERRQDVARRTNGVQFVHNTQRVSIIQLKAAQWENAHREWVKAGKPPGGPPSFVEKKTLRLAAGEFTSYLPTAFQRSFQNAIGAIGLPGTEKSEGKWGRGSKSRGR